MAFVPISSSDIAVGKPLKQSLFAQIKSNFDDLNDRLSSVESVSHVAVTVEDSDSIDLTLTGQKISAVVKPSGVSHNALADVQAAASGVTHGHITDQAQTIAGAKTFTSEVTVPTATQSGSAVNKGQMESFVNNQKGVANGLATLDSNAKIPLSQIPDSILGQLEYKGTFDASGGSFPSSPQHGNYWIISVAGTLGGTLEVSVGDWIIYHGTDGWAKIDNTDAVSSVNGKTGTVVLTKSDVGLGNVDNTSDLDKPISTATQAALDQKSNVGHEHTVASNKITDLRIQSGKFQYHDGSQWVSVDIGGIKDVTYSTQVGDTAVQISHGISDISKIIAQSSSVKIGSELFIQGSVVGIGVEKFSVRITEQYIIIDPFEDLQNNTVRVHLSVLD